MWGVIEGFCIELWRVVSFKMDRMKEKRGIGVMVVLERVRRSFYGERRSRGVEGAGSRGFRRNEF